MGSTAKVSRVNDGMKVSTGSLEYSQRLQRPIWTSGNGKMYRTTAIFLILTQKWLFLTKNRPFWPKIYFVSSTAKISRVNDGMKVLNGPLEYS